MSRYVTLPAVQRGRHIRPGALDAVYERLKVGGVTDGRAELARISGVSPSTLSAINRESKPGGPQQHAMGVGVERKLLAAGVTPEELAPPDPAEQQEDAIVARLEQVEAHLLEQDARQERVEALLERALRLLGDPPEGDEPPSARVVYRPASLERRTAPK